MSRKGGMPEKRRRDPDHRFEAGRQRLEEKRRRRAEAERERDGGRRPTSETSGATIHRG